MLPITARAFEFRSRPVSFPKSFPRPPQDHFCSLGKKQHFHLVHCALWCVWVALIHTSQVPQTSLSLTRKQNTEFLLTCVWCRLSYSFPLAPLTESEIPLKLGNSWQCFMVLICFKRGWQF